MFQKLSSVRFASLFVIKLIQRKAYMLIIFACLILLAYFVQVKFNLVKFYSNDIAVGVVGTFQEHDIPLEVTRLVSQSLMIPDQSDQTVPSLVDSFEVSEDAKVFTFKIKKGLKWSDRSILKISDIDFKMPDVETSFPDDNTVIFKLKEPYSPFPSLLTKPIFKKGTLIGTGPYKIEKIDKSRIFITKISLNTDRLDLPKVTFRFYPNERIANIGFELGEVQALLGVNSTEDLSQNPLVEVKQKTDYSKMVMILFNTKDQLLANRSLRQALSFSAPTAEGVDRAKGPFPPMSWAYNKDLKDYLASSDEAKDALKRAQSSVSDDSFKKELVLTSSPHLQNIGNKIVSNWKQLGFNASLKVEPGVPQNFQVLLITQSIPADPDQYSLWHSTQDKTNLTKYSSGCCPASARVDKDLEDGRKLVKQEDRKAKYEDFQKVISEDAPAVFLYFPKYNIVYLRKAEDKLDKVIEYEKI